VLIDYTGQTVQVTNPETGEIKAAQIFVAVPSTPLRTSLGASNYTYAEVYTAQSQPHWLGAHVRALTFFGGVPAVLVPDNLKSGVKSPDRYEPDINPSYHEYARHYGVAIVPARSRKPKDKAKVEVGVQVVERWILARLRDRTFFSLAGLNQAIRELLCELNDRPMKHLGQSRRELFVELDQPALKPLPNSLMSLPTGGRRGCISTTTSLSKEGSIVYLVGIDAEFADNVSSHKGYDESKYIHSLDQLLITSSVNGFSLLRSILTQSCLLFRS
jgi:hypothetical protein